MVEHHVERGGLTGLQRFFGARVNLGFEAAAAERAGDFTVGKKQRLGADALRAGTFRAGNQREHERPVFSQRGGKLLIEPNHKFLADKSRRFYSNGNEVRRDAGFDGRDARATIHLSGRLRCGMPDAV